MKVLYCKDAGKDCNFVARGETVDEVIRKAAEHSKNTHGMKESDFTPEVMSKIKSVIKDEPRSKVA